MSMQRFALAVGMSLVAAMHFAAPLSAQETQHTAALKPEPLAQLSAKIAAQYPAARALVLARGNCILHEYYAHNVPETQWPVRSVTKSVLSILVGIAIDKGLLRLDQKLPELIAEARKGTIDPRAADITLRDLLTMSSGFDPHETLEVPGIWNSSTWMMRRTVKHTPGTHFFYDDQGTNLIAIILGRAVGGNIAEFARRELFAPLQIDRYQWMADGDGNLPGASGLLLTGKDMMKIGLLYLQQGRWGERQVVSKAYVLESTRKHIDGGEPVHAGYGYLWWTRPLRDGLPAYFAEGSRRSSTTLCCPQRRRCRPEQRASAVWINNDERAAYSVFERSGCRFALRKRANSRI
jgi:CubicO group peptidase (beta-lactamase class C family)